MATKETAVQDDPFAGMEEAKSQWIKWGKPGDWIRGTLTNVSERESQMADKKGQIEKVYEFLASGGSFYWFEKIAGEIKMDSTPTVLEKGSIWVVGGNGKASIENIMRNVKIGQIFGMRFAEEKPSKNPSFSNQKVIKVMIGEMDPEYQGQTGADVAGA